MLLKDNICKYGVIMINSNQKRASWQDYLIWSIYGSSIISQIVLIFLFYDYYRLSLLTWLGWGFFGLFCIIGALPRYEFKKKGKAEEGKSFIHTTKLVTTGIYTIIRHPYWLCWILLSVSLAFLSQHWIMVILAILASSFVYLETFKLDNGLIEKFGEEYKRYIKKVPRMNLLLGLIIYFIRESKNN